MQLLLFEEPLEEKHKREMQELKESFEKVRKGQYAKITSLQKQVNDLRLEIEFLKINICRGKLL